MKNRLYAIVPLLLLFPLSLLAKGGGYSCGHAYANTAVIVAASHHSYNSLKGFPTGSFPATVIYNQDTINGSVQYKNKHFFVVSSDTSLKIDPDDLGLKSLTVHKLDTTLMLVRLTPKDRQLYRVIHSGKLDVYDTRSDFNRDARHINFLTIAQNGKVLPMGGFKSQRRWLAIYINQTYGALLSPKEASWEELLAYLNRMD